MLNAMDSRDLRKEEPSAPSFRNVSSSDHQVVKCSSTGALNPEGTPTVAVPGRTDRLRREEPANRPLSLSVADTAKLAPDFPRDTGDAEAPPPTSPAPDLSLVRDLEDARPAPLLPPANWAKDDDG